MDSFHRHVRICDLEPSEQTLRHWSNATEAIASDVLRINAKQLLFELANDLAEIIGSDCESLGPLGRLVAATGSSRHGIGMPRNGQSLESQVRAMLAVCTLTSESATVSVKRGALAVGVWSALSFQRPLREERLERLRAEVLRNARREALRFAERTRSRSSEDGGGADAAKSDDTTKACGDMEAEDNAILRWLLADESKVFGLPFGTLPPETAAVVSALELGPLLAHLPTMGHYRLAEHFVKDTVEVDLQQLLDAIHEHQEPLIKLHGDHPVVEACPRVFPMLTALTGPERQVDGGRAKRPLREWWQRGLLESATAAFGARRRWK